MDTLSTLHISHLPVDLAVYIALYTDLKNASFLRQQLLDGNTEFEYAFLDATSILSTTHILAAVFRAVNDMKNGRMKSRNVHSEIVFALSPNNNIAESFRRFGITDNTSELIVVKLAVSPDVTADTVSRHLSSVIEGTPNPFDDGALRSITDIGKLRKSYKLKIPSKTNSQWSIGKKEGINRTENDEYERRELEVSILGLMALRGAT